MDEDNENGCLKEENADDVCSMSFFQMVEHLHDGGKEVFLATSMELVKEVKAGRLRSCVEYVCWRGGFCFTIKRYSHGEQVDGHMVCGENGNIEFVERKRDYGVETKRRAYSKK